MLIGWRFEGSRVLIGQRSRGIPCAHWPGICGITRADWPEVRGIVCADWLDVEEPTGAD